MCMRARVPLTLAVSALATNGAAMPDSVLNVFDTPYRVPAKCGARSPGLDTNPLY